MESNYAVVCCKTWQLPHTIYNSRFAIKYKNKFVFSFYNSETYPPTASAPAAPTITASLVTAFYRHHSQVWMSSPFKQRRWAAARASVYLKQTYPTLVGKYIKQANKKSLGFLMPSREHPLCYPWAHFHRCKFSSFKRKVFFCSFITFNFKQFFTFSS